MIGVTERLSLKEGTRNLETSLEPYFLFDREDHVCPSFGTKLHMRVDVTQSGYALNARRADGGYDTACVIPTTPSFVGTSWHPINSGVRTTQLGAPELFT